MTLSFFNRLANVTVAAVFAAVCGFACFQHAPEFWVSCEQTVPAAGVVLGMIAVVTTGWFAVEARKF